MPELPKSEIPKSALVNTRTESPQTVIAEKPAVPKIDVVLDAPISSFERLKRRGRMGG